MKRTPPSSPTSDTNTPEDLSVKSRRNTITLTPQYSFKRSGSFLSRIDSSSYDVKSTLTYSEDLFTVIPEENVNEAENASVMALSVSKGGHGALVGWQIEITDPKAGSHRGVRVVAGVKKSTIPGGKTLYLIVSPNDYTPDAKTHWEKAEAWVSLKRAKNKGGLSFKLLRKVAEF